ncbi:hypothetical protein [Nocardioides sp.]|uniref:hypothetical protein n=1 Tax=Nocardioides sp. TaxID=35761 RepID=UPI002D1FA7B3|nr:hypothetical protein [Nocardioides sp.]
MSTTMLGRVSTALETATLGGTSGRAMVPVADGSISKESAGTVTASAARQRPRAGRSGAVPESPPGW